MKLVHVNDVVYAYASGDASANGGAERYAWLLARALAGAGWSVVIGVRDRLRAQERVSIDGVEFVGLQPGHPIASWYRFLKAEQPDWWFWQCADHWLGPGVEIARVSGVKTIFSAMHDLDIHPRRALFRRPNLWPSYAWGLAWTDRILVQHERQLSQLRAKWRGKASILPGIVTSRPFIKPHSDRERYVAWVGVLRHHKRPDVLIEIARRMPATRFVVCGGTTTFRTPAGYAETVVDALRALPNVEYLGQVNPARTLQIISDAALLLSTSDDEGLPSVFLEAWAGGTPVVSLNVDPDRRIECLRLGALSGTVDRAMSDIASLLESAEARDAISSRAVRHVGEHHSAEAAVRVFETSIRQLPAGRVPTPSSGPDAWRTPAR